MFEELHVTLPVRFCVLLSLNVPVAMYCCVRPAATDAVAGVTAMDCNVAAVTVSDAVPVMLPLLAVIVVVPAASA